MLKERGVLCKLSQGGVAGATSHKLRLKADAGLDENRSHGFTLLEVMIALSIVGIALIALMGLAQRSITINDQTQQITRATLLAQGKMAEIEAGVETDQGATEAVFPEPDQDYRWRTSYGPTPVTGVQQVDLVVAWGMKIVTRLFA